MNYALDARKIPQSLRFLARSVLFEQNDKQGHVIPNPQGEESNELSLEETDSPVIMLP